MFKDPILLKLVKKYGDHKFENRSKFLFEDLVDSIIGQQLSAKAALTILKRFKALFNNKDQFPTADEILKKRDATIRKAGISFAKIKYIKEVAKAYKRGELEYKKFLDMTDEEVIAELTKIKGVGKWTAEMTLIFTLGRPDVFSIGDGGLRRAVKNLYKLEKEIEIIKLTEKWKPNRSLAAWYLWRSLENK
jgi:DNA-3-methyladenine glycosylase II